jgi:4-diphosphocytidyl-2-C-methyl-D-erythritol kinase
MIQKKAYAKINLFLNVLDKRKDGYHNLEMINAKIDLYDDIQLKKCHLSTGIIIKSNDLFLSSQDNIILQCARYMQDEYHIDYGIQISIDKKIPYGAGLGGNSSDAAAVIHGINELAGLNLDLEEMQEIGQMFGADIPYCLIDDVACVKKTGEDIKTIKNELKGQSVLLIHPNKHILTSDVFKYADQKTYQQKDMALMIQAINQNHIEQIQANMFNSLEDVVVEMDKKMHEFKQMLIENIGQKGLVMTGSGSTFIQLISSKTDKIKHFINKNKEHFFINVYKIV